MKKLLGIFLFSLALIFWASAFVAIRYSLADYHPGSLALLRYLIASLVIFLFYKSKWVKITPIRLRDVPMIILVGIFGFGLYNILLNYSELTVTASVASFIVAQMPVLTTLLALFFLGESSHPAIWVGMVFSIIGTLLIAISNPHEAPVYQAGIILAIGATISSTLYNVLQKPLLKRYHPIQLTCYAIWSGTILLLIYTPQLMHDVQHASTNQTLVVIYLGIFPAALGYLIWTYALSFMTASKVVSALYLSPLITTFLGWLLINEIPNTLEITGGLIALTGAYIVNRKRTKRPTTLSIEKKL